MMVYSASQVVSWGRQRRLQAIFFTPSRSLEEMKLAWQRVYTFARYHAEV